MAFMMIRTNTPASLISKTFGETKINIPRAPALGLLLERTVFEGHNKRIIARKLDNEPITFEPFEEQMNAFKKEWIYSRIYQEERQENVFEVWTRSVDENMDSFAWYLNSDGSIDESRKPLDSRELLVKEDEEVDAE